MAKDKSKKNKATGDDEFAKPSEASSGEGWKLTEEARDRLVLFTPLREQQIDDKFNPGQKKDIIVADVVVLTDKKGRPLAEPEEHSEVFIFQGYIQGALRGSIGERMVLGVVRNTETTTKARSNAGGFYWELEDADEDQVQIAKDYRASLDPFSQKKNGKKADADEKPVKDKKSKDKKKAKK